MTMAEQVSADGTLLSAMKVQEKGAVSTAGLQPEEWGIAAQCSGHDVRAFLYKWPAGSAHDWAKLKRWELPEHDVSTPHDPHLLKITEGIEDMVELARTSDDGLHETVSALFSPLWETASRFVPSEAWATTRVLLSSIGDVRRIAPTEQCKLWSAIRTTLKQSPFAGEIQLVSLADAYPFTPLTCDMAL